jgi:hypothetical protein
VAWRVLQDAAPLPARMTDRDDYAAALPPAAEL